MTTAPVVSVITNFLNEERFITEAIDKAVVGEVQALERYLDDYLQTTGLTFDQWLDTFGCGMYAHRNEQILRLLAPRRPRRIFEFACAGGFLASLLLENISSIDQYTCSNYSERVVDHCRRHLARFPNCDVVLVDADVTRSTDITNAALGPYDTFITTGFEHIEHDRELIGAFPAGASFVFCVAGFDDPEHFRLFENIEQITARYADVLSIEHVETIGDQAKKFVVVSTIRPRSSGSPSRGPDSSGEHCT